MGYPTIETMLPWGDPREVKTSRGPRILRKAPPDDFFWAMWGMHRQYLQDRGIQLSKDLKTQAPRVCWWQHVDQADLDRRALNIRASRAATSDFDPPRPPGLNYYPFQRAAIEFAVSKNGVLFADEMGLGKTLEAIGVLNCRQDLVRVLVVTKASLKVNWKRELQKWLLPEREIAIVEGQGGFPKEDDIVIINYDILQFHYHSLREREWDCVILDESHNIANRDTKRAKSIIGYVPSKKKQQNGARVLTPIPKKVAMALSGTPFDNKIQELWSTLNFLDPVRWASFWQYARRYCDARKGPFGFDCSGSSNLEELQQVLRSTCMIRRMKADVLTELPPKTRMIVEIDTTGLEHVIRTDAQRSLNLEQTFEEAQADLEIARASDDEAEFRRAVDRMDDVQLKFTEIAAIRKATAIAKVPAVTELLKEDIEAAGKILVFAHHHDVLDALHKSFPNSVLITGSTPAGDRQKICDLFQTQPRITPFLGSIRACGEGLTLTAAKMVCFVEEDWCPGKISQAEDRAHRIGQRDNVLVKHYILPGTCDARMIKTTMAKQEDIDKALNDDIGLAEPVLAPHRPLGRRKEYLNEALLILESEIHAVHAALRVLASARGAVDPVDRRIARRLADFPKLAPGQACLGRRLCQRYAKLLPAEMLQATDKTPDTRDWNPPGQEDLHPAFKMD